MHRTDAIARLAEHALRHLGEDERTEILQGTWRGPGDEPPDDGGSPRHDSLILAQLRDEYAGVLNAYLSRRLAAIGTFATVEGELEYRAACPCCSYRSLSPDNEWEICSVCFWENDGSEPDEYSGANHMTLGEARDAFARLGAVDERCVEFVLVDGPERYPRVD